MYYLKKISKYNIGISMDRWGHICFITYILWHINLKYVSVNYNNNFKLFVQNIKLNAGKHYPWYIHSWWTNDNTRMF